MASKRKQSVKEATPAPQVQAKKAKKDPMQEQFREIIAAWEKAPASEEVKKMLAEILPNSLGEYSDQRHKFQERVVDAVAGIMAEAEAAFSKEINDTRSQQAEAAKEKPLRDTEAAEATAKVDAAKTETQRLKVLLAESAIAFRTRTDSLADAVESKKLDAQKSQEASKKKADFETALEDLVFLKTIALEEPEAKKKHDELSLLLKKYKFEESMMIALPAALAKAPDSRGQFDTMVFEQLEAEIGKKTAEQESILVAAKPEQDKCEAVVREAQDHLNEARATQRLAAQNFDTASKHQSTCEEALNTSQKTLRGLTNSLKRLEKAVYEAEAELEIFQQGPMEAFKTLRTRTTPPPAVEQEAVQPPVVEEEAVARRPWRWSRRLKRRLLLLADRRCHCAYLLIADC
jgi:hypothetical protein